MHIYEIWQNDLNKFLEALEDYENGEEEDRLAHGTANHGGANKKKGRARAKKGEPKKAAVETAKGAKKDVPKQQSMQEFMKKQKPKDEAEMGLMERIKMRAQVQEPATNPAANFKTSVLG